MRVTLESTSKIVTINGIPSRVWEGYSENGTKCHAFIARIACNASEDAMEFERDLDKCEPPSEEVQSIPSRLIL